MRKQLYSLYNITFDTKIFFHTNYDDYSSIILQYYLRTEKISFMFSI